MSSEQSGPPAGPTPADAAASGASADGPEAGAAPHPADVKFTRTAALWSSLILGFLILIVLLIFITQNTESVTLTFLSWHLGLPLGVAILLAAVCGGLVTAGVSAARMFQLRRVAKKNLEVARLR